MSGNSSGRTVASKVTAILRTFTEGHEHSLMGITRLTGLPTSTTYRLAGELAALRLLERTQDGRYRVALALRMIGFVDACPPDVAERGPRVLEDICASINGRVRLGVLRGSEVAFIERTPETRTTTTFSAGATVPAQTTAIGRALLAFSPPRVVTRIVTDGADQGTAQSMTSPEGLRRALELVRMTGVAFTRSGSEPRVCAVAMPVFGPGGKVITAIEVSGFTTRRDVRPAVAALTIATRSLSRELSGDARRAVKGRQSMRTA